LKLSTTDRYLKLESKYKQLLGKVGNWTGVTINNFDDFYCMLTMSICFCLLTHCITTDVYDVLFVQRAHQLLDIPEILTNWDEIEQMSNAAAYLYYDRDMQGKLGAGPLIDLVFNTMSHTIDNVTTYQPNPKYIHYSAHDTTLQSIFATLNIVQHFKELQGIPPYGSQILFELHREDGKYSVQVVIRLGYNGIFKPYKLPSICEDELCPWLQFTKYINTNSRLSVNTWCTQCSNDFTSPCSQKLLLQKKSENAVLLIAVPVIIGAWIVTGAIMGVICLRTYTLKKKTSLYTPIA
jgi:hypothetical protein